MQFDPHRKLAAVLTLSILAGCSSLNDPVIRTLNQVIGTNQNQSPSRFDPNYRYLRILVDGRESFLALGNVDDGTEVWYSASHEVLRLRDGRIAGVSGVFTEWRNVVFPGLPSWSALADIQSPYGWTRKRDVMPGYRYGVVDHLKLYRIAAPRDSQLAGIPPDKLDWFEEDDLSATESLPPARYAFDHARNEIIYGEACLSDTLCISWQRWPESLHR